MIHSSSEDTIDKLIQVFDSWSQVTPFKFIRRNTSYEIEILLTTGYHGHYKILDGPFYKFAHAALPHTSRYICFDYEFWAEKTQVKEKVDGIDFV